MLILSALMIEHKRIEKHVIKDLLTTNNIKF